MFCYLFLNLEISQIKIDDGELPYLGLYNVQDFAQILYFVGGEHIINRKKVWGKEITIFIPDGKHSIEYLFL